MSKLRCLCCDRAMENIMGEHGHQPNDGLSFHSYGHYGTTFFDPMDGSYIKIAICDECLVKADAEGKIFYSQKPKEYSIADISDMNGLIERSRIVKRKSIGDDEWEIVDGPK